MEEVWKVIDFKPGYSVSTMGRIKNNKTNEIEELRDNGNGYLIKFGESVHRIVGNAFIPNPEGKSQINHKNGIKSDNRVNNLEWVTPSENIQHAYRTGLAKATNGFTGKHHTEESRKKISESHKRENLSEATRRKLSEAHKGHDVSEETRKKMSESNKGKKRSEETLKRIGEAKKGNKNTKGLIWVNNGVENHMINLEKLQEYLTKGYVKGRKLLVG